MTAGHGNGSEQLAHDVNGGHDEDRIQEALQVAADAGGFDFMVGDEYEDHQRPGKFRHQIRRGAPDAKQADEI